MKQTRKERARKLMTRLEQGPMFSSFFDQPLTLEETRRRYKLLCETWILPEVQDLIPELKKDKENAE